MAAMAAWLRFDFGTCTLSIAIGSLGRMSGRRGSDQRPCPAIGLQWARKRDLPCPIFSLANCRIA
jgi:hypothetical protein